MHEEKSRGSGLESRETRLECYGLRDPRGGSRGSSGKMGRHASSGHGTDPIKRKRAKRWLCKVDRPSDHDHLFTGRVRAVRNPLNVMARLSEVVGGNGTR
ncbi:hypothetical protein CRG98_032829 [Punica granatum]|uniref:Uncharacterized protein n=1 Tax=Punica granatum TaxID=22663 RepID=A0A2I0IS14_PUNGR|nr:hypothetical protein CRG98_032829 [Punica granatum]